MCLLSVTSVRSNNGFGSVLVASLTQMLDVLVLMLLAIVLMFAPLRSEDELVCDSAFDLSRCHRCSQFRYKLAAAITSLRTPVNLHQRETSPAVMFQTSAPDRRVLKRPLFGHDVFPSCWFQLKKPRLTFNHTHQGTDWVTERSRAVIR